MGGRISRRDILKASAFGAVGAALQRPLEAFAGPFSAQDYRTLVPRDKKLDPAWVKGLTERGEEPWVSGDALRHIGMPVGGLFAGTVYLGGDGRLWNWDVFNQHHQGCVARPGGVPYDGETVGDTGGANYVDPPTPESPPLMITEIRLFDHAVGLDTVAFHVKFLGQYPVGTVNYVHRDGLVEVTLEAFSPFVPLDIERSSYPATVLRYSVKNTSKEELPWALSLSCKNPCAMLSRKELPSLRPTSALQNGALSGCLFGAQATQPSDARSQILFEDFESGSYDGWTVEGTAFGGSPQLVSKMPSYQGEINASGKFVVNSHNVRQGESVEQGDAHVGRLTSRPFKIERSFVNFRIGGGNHPGKTCLNLLVDGRAVRTATGHNSNRMRLDNFNVSDLQGKEARLEIVDQETGGWGNIGVDQIVFADEPAIDGRIEDLADFGTFFFGLIGGAQMGLAFEYGSGRARVASVDYSVSLAPGETTTVTYIVSWHFPNLQIPGFPGKKRWYASKWKDALDVAQDIAKNIDELTRLTLKWRDTWYDSTLPYWLLDRTFANTSILATNTCHRFEDGRFWFWEGIGCCPGTCTHVWSYAQAAARVFPEIEAYLREKIDFGEFFHAESGAIDYRAESERKVAHDGQCGCVMRAYREHTMQRDSQFLKRVWPNVKKAMQFLIAQDKDRDGLLEGEQYNTLDAAWYGKMAWISSMYLGALRACEKMATEMGDRAFAEECRGIVKKGSKDIVDDLFNGEYFIHLPDPKHPEANATATGCHIDQLYGQSWCHWMGLERVVPHEESKIALSNLYKYNFTPDVGPYRKGMQVIKGGRWYAVPGEGGLIMCTFPKGGAERATGAERDAWAAMYFNECMSGFEHQAAAHMVAEGLLTEGLTVERAIHDRYSPQKRNPYNEIECSDHYGRAMASFGVFWNVCGYNVHGPSRKFEADPKIPGPFRAAFIDAHGWGTYEKDGSAKRTYHFRNSP